MVVAANEKLQKVQDILANFVQAWLLVESTHTYAAPSHSTYGSVSKPIVPL